MTLVTGIPLGASAPSSPPRRRHSKRGCKWHWIGLLAIYGVALYGGILNLFSALRNENTSEDDDLREYRYYSHKYNQPYSFKAITHANEIHKAHVRDVISVPTHTTRARVLSLTSDTFDDVLHNSKAAFVHFYVPWCVHCQMIAPVWEELAGNVKEHGMTVGKVDCDKYHDLCRNQEILKYPTLRWFFNNKRIDYKMNTSTDALMEFVKNQMMNQDKVLDMSFLSPQHDEYDSND